MKKIFKQYKVAFTFLFCSFILLAGCRKFIEVEPPATNINEANVYQSDGSAISSIVGIYTRMSSTNFPALMSFLPEFSADNLLLLNPNLQIEGPYYRNGLLASDGAGTPKPWLLIYPNVYLVNAAIEGLNSSKTLTPAVKNNLLGQVYFLRAYFYFYLTNFYGDLPLALSTSYKVNNLLSKTPADQIYAQIISDLKQAQSLLPDSYLQANMVSVFPAGGERIIPNRSAATALLARIYLYRKDWANAELNANEVITNSSLYTINLPLDQVFLKNSKETIWSLQPVNFGANAGEADLFTLQADQPTENSAIAAYLGDEFIRNFQIGDQRKTAWIDIRTTNNKDYPYPAKYKVVTFSATVDEYSIVLRLAEQYLIRAEARIEQDKLTEGISDLNMLRDRAIDKTETDLDKRLKPWATTLSKEQATAALGYERRVELFAEQGHRWFDLKRTGQVNTVMSKTTPVKGGTWSDYKALYPIPADELGTNKNLLQNPGYTN